MDINPDQTRNIEFHSIVEDMFTPGYKSRLGEDISDIVFSYIDNPYPLTEIYEKFFPGTTLVQGNVHNLIQNCISQYDDGSPCYDTVVKTKLDKEQTGDGIRLSTRNRYITGFDFESVSNEPFEIPKTCYIALRNGSSVRKYNIVRSRTGIGYELISFSNPDEPSLHALALEPSQQSGEPSRHALALEPPFFFISFLSTYEKTYIRFDPQLPEGITLYQIGGEFRESVTLSDFFNGPGILTDRFRHIEYIGGMSMFT